MVRSGAVAQSAGDDDELLEDDELLLEALLLPPEDDEDPLPLEDDGVDELLEPLTLPALLLELVLLPECELLLSELDALLKLLDAPKLLGELLPLDDEKWLELTLPVDDELVPFPPPPLLAGLLPPQAAVQRPNPTMPTRYREIVRVLISREAFHSVECRG